ncbi:hypothetical protein K438DRAFT_1840007 [Mycena galopus ATCC 62051]|nr:hypothetical protein K438DRAFT_1840007 [Mycena galopus ATCC 62051]
MQQRIRELEAQIAQNSTSQATPSIPNESIDHPKNASKRTMQAIRAKLGYDKTRWYSFRSYCRDAATFARLNWDGNWKSQRSEKLSMAYNAPTTFRGKEAAARRARRVQSPASTSCTFPASPTPGPSRRRPSTHRNSNLGSDEDDNNNNGDWDNEDEFVAASDHEAPPDEQDEDERERMTAGCQRRRKESAKQVSRAGRTRSRRGAVKPYFFCAKFMVYLLRELH